MQVYSLLVIKKVTVAKSLLRNVIVQVFHEYFGHGEETIYTTDLNALVLPLSPLIPRFLSSFSPCFASFLGTLYIPSSPASPSHSLHHFPLLTPLILLPRPRREEEEKKKGG